ncbi:succinate dehydrogenase hydrophobic membrane anchor protein [Candidatus Blochmanniella floridana]|uniref:Succinate dehydrogenase hydrophobic membrane anchor subunit n=1 Tax=Blochmanniella floridana TaxID=203907 RepID=Q7VR94_BLOFL|nr:succinate dehydrogenase hydrophobic membrane anchor protein [Candidatus Blochmannia floridanus]
MESMKLNHKYYGVYEWLIVRISAILTILYSVYLFNFINIDDNFSYEKWCIFFYDKKIKIFNTIVLLMLLKHTWIGMRHILEDYISSIILRRLSIGLIHIILYVYLLFGIAVVWGI